MMRVVASPWTVIAFALAFAVSTCHGQQTDPPLSRHGRRIRSHVAAVHSRVQVTVVMKNGSIYRGTVNHMEAVVFWLDEVAQAQPVRIAYRGFKNQLSEFQRQRACLKSSPACCVGGRHRLRSHPDTVGWVGPRRNNAMRRLNERKTDFSRTKVTVRPSAYGSLRRIALRIPDQEPTSTSTSTSTAAS